MVFAPPQDLVEFTRATKYCNADDESVVAQAEALAKKSHTPMEAAMRIHSWVRDRFLLGYTMANEKASETLQGDLGWCTTKTNLQIALLRAIGIPARFHQVAVTKKVLKSMVSGPLYRVIPEPIWFHPWCECWLDSRWVTCDLWIDKFTFLAARNSGVIDPKEVATVEWNGKDDLNLVEPWMLEDRGTMASYDQVVDEVVSAWKAIPNAVVRWLLNGSNRHTAKYREKYGQPA